jgi:hypothetical protein
MKRVMILVGASIAAACTGCQDSFSPKIPFQEIPVVFCVLKASYTRLPSGQEAVVSRTYDVEGVDPAAPHADPALSGVKLTVRANSREYLFAERVVPGEDSSKFAQPGTYAHASVVLYPFDSLSLNAVLPDGKTLRARTFVPSLVGLESVPLYAHGFTTRVNRFTEGEVFSFDWDDGNQEEHLFFPKLSLVYSEKVGTREVGRTLEVPFQYVNQNGGLTPVYPSSQTAKTCAFPFDVIDEAMRQIGAGKPDSTVITVMNIVFDLTEFDFALSRYYASVNGYLDRYSVRTDESIYSNISGGIGIFGSRMDSKYSYPMDRKYVESFGYRYAGPN